MSVSQHLAVERMGSVSQVRPRAAHHENAGATKLRTMAVRRSTYTRRRTPSAVMGYRPLVIR